MGWDGVSNRLSDSAPPARTMRTAMFLTEASIAKQATGWMARISPIFPVIRDLAAANAWSLDDDPK